MRSTFELINNEDRVKTQQKADLVQSEKLTDIATISIDNVDCDAD